MSYNIPVGGTAPGSHDRTEALLAVLAAESPDVVALQEAAGFMPSERGLVATYETRLGLKGLVASGGSSLHVALLARPELDLQLAATCAEPFRHGALAATIACGSRRVMLITAHLNPFVEDARLDEVDALLGMLPANAEAVLAGDLNALSPQDSFPPARLKEMRMQFRVMPPSKSLSDQGPEHAECRALARLIDAGFVDLAHAIPDGDLGPTYPTPSAQEAAASPLRIDYLMATRGLAAGARGLRRVRTAAAAEASDHFPVVCDLEI